MSDKKKLMSAAEEQMLLGVVREQGVRGSVLNAPESGEPATILPPDLPGHEPESEPEPLPEAPSMKQREEAPAVSDNRRRRVIIPFYDEILLGGINTKKVSSKTVYINEKLHEGLTTIVSRLTYNKVNISTYVENIIRQHFATYRDEINERSRKSNEDILKW